MPKHFHTTQSSTCRKADNRRLELVSFDQFSLTDWLVNKRATNRKYDIAKDDFLLFLSRQFFPIVINNPHKEHNIFQAIHGYALCKLQLVYFILYLQLDVSNSLYYIKNHVLRLGLNFRQKFVHDVFQTEEEVRNYKRRITENRTSGLKSARKVPRELSCSYSFDLFSFQSNQASITLSHLSNILKHLKHKSSKISAVFALKISLRPLLVWMLVLEASYW